LEIELAAALASDLKSTPTGRNPYGVVLILAALVMAGMSTLSLARDHNAVAQALWEMLRL
jgi:hypothetical protein